MDAKGQTALEELRKTLGLDAMVVLANTSQSWNEGVLLTGIHLYLYGHNPVPMPPQKVAQWSWSEGASYGHGQFGKGFKGSQIATLKKGTLTEEVYDGYDGIVTALARVTIAGFEEQYEDAK
jgi:hypothetical protein